MSNRQAVRGTVLAICVAVLCVAVLCGSCARTQQPARAVPAAPTKKTVAGEAVDVATSPAKIRQHVSVMFRGGPARRGRVARVLPLSAPRVLWRYVTGRAIASAPAIDRDGNIYLSSVDGFLYSLTARGELRFKADLGASSFSSPALVDGAVLVGSDDDMLQAIDAGSGKMRWEFELGPCETHLGFGADSVRCHGDGSPLVAAGLVFYAADAVYALSKRGVLRWRTALPGHARSSLAFAGGVLVVGTQSHSVFAFDAAKGKKLWRFDTQYHLDSTPAVFAGTVYIGGDDGFLYALDLKTGAPKWRFRSRRPLRASPAVGPAGVVYISSLDGNLHAIGEGGKLLWTAKLTAPSRSSPLVGMQGTLITGAHDGTLHGIRDGQVLWTVTLPAAIDGGPVVAADGTVLVGCRDGVLYALK